ncbi:MAG: ABC transporter permease [Thermofilaceae archaeon]
MPRSILLEIFGIKKFTISIVVIAALIIAGLVGPTLYKVDPLTMRFAPERPPSSENPLGTDTYGRDVLAQLLHGIRMSLYIGATAALIALTIGTLIGAIAGVKGGLMDDALMAVTNIVIAMPSILLMMLIAAYFKYRDPILVAVIIGVTSWPWVARAVRAQMLSLKEREFIYFSRMAGYGDFRIAVEDLLPNLGAYIFMAFVLLMSGAMIAEAGLSMIGVGITQGTSLGIILYWAQMMEAVRRGLWWWFLPPGAVLVSLAASLLMISTALDEYFSPRLKER